MNIGEYTITVNRELEFVHVIARGEFPASLGEEMITKARKTAAQLRYPILCDVRESVAKVSLADWFMLPRRLWVYINAETRGVRTAIVVNPGNQEKVYRFFETVTFNLGLRIRIFLKEEAAKEWLATLVRDAPKQPD